MRRRTARIMIMAFAAGVAVPWPAAVAQMGPQNLDFESGELGLLPEGWHLPTEGFRAVITDESPYGGNRCALLEPDGAKKTEPFGNIMQAVEGGPYRGKIVRYRAAVRVQSGWAMDRAQLWMRVDRPENRAGFLDNMQDRPIRDSTWACYEVVGAVADDAVGISFGMLLFGNSKAWLDDVSFEIIGEAPKVEIEPPRPLAGRGLENLVAFTRLLGYVRHFHPSDQAAETNWDRFAIEGVRMVEAVQDAEELARTLEDLFRPIAPTVRVFETGQTPSLPRELALPSDATALRLTAWEHQGFGPSDGSSAYTSKRVFRAVVGGAVPADLPDPARPFIADLGGGASCLVPLGLYADSKGTIPKAPGQQTPGDKLLTPYYSGDDRATRLAGVALCWNVMQHFYSYFDVVDTDWAAALPAALPAAATDQGERAYLDTLRRLIAQLHDGQANVWHASDRDNAWLPLGWEWIEDEVVATAVDPHLPPDLREMNIVIVLKPGDVIRAINDQHTGAVTDEAERLVSAATRQFRQRQALELVSRGVYDEVVFLDVQRGEEEPRRVRLRRNAQPQDIAERRPKKIVALRPGVFYVDLTRITDEDFNAALPDLAQANGIVFDFRGRPTTLGPFTFLPHLITQPATSPQWHVPVVHRPDRQDLTFTRMGEWRLTPRAPYLGAKKAFIADGRCIGYAESCLGIIEYYKLGEIVGEATGGTNGDINQIMLPGGYRVSWTGMKVLKHDGARHHGVGIRPTVPVTRTIQGVSAGRDELLERAVEVVAPDNDEDPG